MLFLIEATENFWDWKTKVNSKQTVEVCLGVCTSAQFFIFNARHKTDDSHFVYFVILHNIWCSLLRWLGSHTFQDAHVHIRFLVSSGDVKHPAVACRIVLPSKLNIHTNNQTVSSRLRWEGRSKLYSKSSQGQKHFAVVPNYSVGFQGWLGSVLRSQFCRD